MEATFEQELNWARIHMTRLRQGLTHLPPLKGVRLACSMHLEFKMVPLLEGLLNQGIELFLTTCNPKTVRNEVVEYLKGKGAKTYAWHNMSPADLSKSYAEALKWEPTHLCEMGADLTKLLHDSGAKSGVRASLEATGSGIARLQQINPLYPIYNWDDLPVKEGLHNRHMVGLMTWHAFLSRTGLTLHEKRVVVIGYGLVGQGVAATARAYGGSISVVERDPVRRLEAAYAGWDVRELQDVLGEADCIVTATGGRSVIGEPHFNKMKDGVFLINVGHHSEEIEVEALLRNSYQEVLPFVKSVQLGKKVIYLFSDGSMANLVAGKGDSLNAFDPILVVMLSGIAHIAGQGEKNPPGVYMLPREVWGPYLFASSPLDL